MAQMHTFNHVNLHLSDVTSRVVAKSGIPTDRYHIGKLVLQAFKDDPEFIAQIDGGTGESENNGSLLKRTVQCAISFRNMGLKHGDVMVIMAPNHLDLAVPFYAAMYLGIVLAPVDRTLKVGELEHTFSIYKPSVVFCQNENIPEIQLALGKLNMDAKIFTFDRQSHGSCLGGLLKANEKEVDNFEAEDFNAEESIITIVPTSGSTGLPKGAALTYKTWTITGPHLWARYVEFPLPSHSWLILSPVQWVTAALHFLVAPYIKYTRVQTSRPVTVEHTRFLIETYRPKCSLITTSMVLHLLNSKDGPCDISCFETIFIAGSAVDKDTLKHIKAASPKTTVINAFGMTELSTITFQGDCPVGSCGKPAGIYQYRLINLDTAEDIQEPYANGELLLKGPMFKNYYNNPEATEAAFTEDGWFKTGDMFYRDAHWNFFFVERIKLLLKYKSFQISPTEIECVIREHPDVLDVVVAAIPDFECGDLPVACVIPRPGCTPTAQQIKDLVKEKLSDAKQLRGGVAFMDAFPLSSTSKINRKKLNEIVREMAFE